MNERLISDKKYWVQKAEQMAEKKSEQTTKFVEIFTECQRQIAQALFATPVQPSFNLAKFSTRDLPQFSREQEASDAGFRWPTVEDLQGMKGQKAFPKLKEIRTSGTADSGLASIQLVFEDGLQSLMFDSKNNSAGPVKSYQIRSDSVISSIEARAGTSWLCKLDLKYEDGQTDAITEDFQCAGLSQTQT